MLTMKSLLASLVLVAGLCSLQGCGSGRDTTPTGTVTGKVTLGGQPLSSVIVEFFSSELGAGSMGVTQEDGTYKTDGTLPIGKYAVTVNPQPPEPGQPENKSNQVPKKYISAKTSGLEFEVTGGANVIDIALEK